MFRLISDWPRGMFASGFSLPTWSLQVSYIGLALWLLISTPTAIRLAATGNLTRRDRIVRAHIWFLLAQLFGLGLSTTSFGAEGFVAGLYILGVCVSFLYTYLFSLHVGYYVQRDGLDRAMKRSVQLLCWSMAPTLLISAIQLVTHSGREIEGVNRLYGGTSSPNVLGAALLVFIAFVATSPPGRNKNSRHFLLIGCSVLFIACFSMSGFASVIFATLLYAVLRASTTGRLQIRPSWLILGIAAAYLLFMVAGTILAARFGELGEKDNSLMWRLRTWTEYYELLSEPRFLFFGGGLGFDHLGMDQEPHNEWIRVLMETGLFGIAFYVALWWRTVSLLQKIVRDSSAKLQRFSTGILAAAGGLLLWSMVDSVLRTAPSALLLWAGVGLVTGLARSERRTATTPVNPEMQADEISGNHTEH